MRVGDIIKHRVFLDVCCEIVAMERKLTGLAVTVKWLNQGFTRSWYLPAKKQSIFIRDVNWGDWLVASDSPTCLRKATWKQI